MGKRRSALAARRRAVGLTQERLAETLQVERSTVVRWEAGDTQPQPWLRPALAQALGLDADQLVVLLESPAETGSPGRLDADEMRRALDALTSSYERLPSVSLVSDAAQLLADIRKVRTTAVGAVARELLTLQARAYVVMSQLIWDASLRRDQHTPRRFLRDAVTSAQEAGDPATEGRAWLRASFLSLYGDHRPRTGLELAQRSAEVAGRSDTEVAGWGQLHVAEAHAYLGDRHSCEVALAAAEGSLSIARRTFARIAGSCYLSLGLSGPAEVQLRMAVTGPTAARKSDAIVWANLARTYVQQGLADDAAGALHRAIDIIETTHAGGGMAVAFTAGHEMARWAHVPRVRESRDRLMALVMA